MRSSSPRLIPALSMVGALTACEPVIYDFRTTAGVELLDPVESDGLLSARASVGTYFDASGQLVVAEIDQPRFDHDPQTGHPLGLLLEDAATNLWLDSRVQSGTVDAYLQTGDTDSYSARPGGLLGNGDFHIEMRRVSTNSLDWEGFHQQLQGLAVGETYALSFVARQAAGDCPIDVMSGLGDVTPSRVELTAVPRRYTVTINASQSSGRIELYCRSGDTGEGWDVSHIQLELGTTSSSIIINDSQTEPASRAADTAWFAGEWLDPEAGSLFLRATPVSLPVDGRLVELSGAEPEMGAVSMKIVERMGELHPAACIELGPESWIVESGLPARARTSLAAAMSFDARTLSLTVDGAPVDSVSTDGLPQFDRLSLGMARHSAVPRPGWWLTELTYWPRVLPKASLRSLTAP